MVATGIEIARPPPPPSSAAASNKKKEPSPPGAVLDVWGSRGSAIGLSLSWHPTANNNKMLAVGRQNGVVDLLTETRKNQHRLSQRHRHPVRAISFTDDGHLLVSGDDAGLLCVWDISRCSAQMPPALVHHVLNAHTHGWILGMTTLPDSRRFITTGTDRKISVWNVEQITQNQATHTFHTDHDVTTIARGCGSHPKRFVTGSDTGWLQMYSLE